MTFRILAAFLIGIFLVPGTANAQCSSPAGNAGNLFYNTTHNVPQYCDGTNWIAMVGAQKMPPACPAGIASCGGKASERTVFVSSDGITGSNSTATADNLCNTLASDAGLLGSYRAWHARSADEAPASRFERSNVPYVQVDGNVISNNWADLTNGTIQLPLNVMETGATVTSMQSVWAFVNPDGTFNSASNCTSGNAKGYTWASDDRWTRGYDGTACNNGGRIYCFEQATNLTQIVPDGLIGHWRLDETSGTTAYDSSGNAYHGTMQNGLDASNDSTSGVIQTALDFDNTGKHVQLPDLGITSNTVSMSAWVFLDSIDDNPIGPIHGRRGSNDSNGFLIRSNLELAWAWDLGQFGNIDSISVPLEKWVFIAQTVSPTELKMYVKPANGELSVATVSDTFDPVTLTNMEIGRDSISGGVIRSIDGKIDDVRVYDRTLTEDEVAELAAARDGIRYNETYRVPEFFDGNQWVAMPPAFPNVTDGLVAHYKFDEPISGTVTDSAGNYDGTLAVIDAHTARRGTVGNALSFGNGVESGMRTSSRPEPETTTLAAWVKFDLIENNGNDQYILATGDDWGPASGCFLRKQRFSPNNFHAMCAYDEGDTAVFASSSFSPVAGRWYHVAATYDSTGTLKLYIDGALEDSTSGGGSSLWYGGNNRIYIADDRLSAHKPWAVIDDARVYDRPLSAAEIQTLYNMGTPEGQNTALPQGCPEIGDVCDDGTIYAGLSVDGNVPMFTTPEDAGRFYFATSNSDGLVSTAATSNTSGSSNTRILMRTDADSETPGFQPHEAAFYCSHLEAFGASDWYVPATFELGTVCENHAAIGGFYYGGGFGYYSYQSSSDIGDASAHHIRYWGGSCSFGSAFSKTSKHRLRCVRKGPAPRCADPYGVEGNMFYNTTHDVVQYCDGARWVAIGKTAP